MLKMCLHAAAASKKKRIYFSVPLWSLQGGCSCDLKPEG